VINPAPTTLHEKHVEIKSNPDNRMDMIKFLCSGKMDYPV
jgi:hypothetical protein